MHVTHTQIKIEDLLGEVKSRVLAGYCPKCGGPSDKPLNLGESIRCKFCGTLYTIERSLNTTSKEAIKNLVSNVVEEVVGKFGVVPDSHLKALSSQLCNYAEKVLEETRKLYTSLYRLPTREELDKKMEDDTQKILVR